MADFIATTVCQPAIINNVDAVTKIMDNYQFEAEILLQNNLLYVYGYEWFTAWKYKTGDDGTDEVDYSNDATNDFLEQLQPYIQDELIIQMIGHEKCRYINAAQITVTQNRITWRTLDCDDYGVLGRLKSYLKIIHEMADDPEMTKTPDEVDEILREKLSIQMTTTAAKAVGAITLLMELADFLNLDVSEYMPYLTLMQ